MRYLIGGAAVALLLVLGAGAYLYWTLPRAQPYNVLLISLDTVRADALGCYGRRPHHAPTLSPSPMLDALASQGVRMLDAYGSSSWTLPSHLSMMTGQPSLVHGVDTESGALDRQTPTLAEILKSHGYATMGIYSAPYLEPHWGFGRGFDRYDAMYAPDVVAASQRASAIRGQIDRAAAAADWAQYDQLEQEQTANDDDLNRSSERASTSDQVTAAALTALERLAREPRPWFLFVHFFDAHCDYAPPPPYDTRFDPDYRGTFTGRNCLRDASVALPDPDTPGGLIRTLSDRDLEHVIALYEGEVAWVDAHVGALLRAVDGWGAAQRTLVIVVGDHGEEFFDHGNLGHRHTLYEESVRVPLLLRLPGVLPAGASIRGPVAVTDILPTVLDIVNLPAPSTPGAASFLPLIRGGDASSRTVLSRLVMMYQGDVAIDADQRVTFRQVRVQDVFRRGPIKITRTRSWPQFPNGLAPSVQAVLHPEAVAQHDREELRWIDVERFPDERDEHYSTSFTDPAARAALDAFRTEYAALAGLRSLPHAVTPLPDHVRNALQGLGYVDPAAGPLFPEPDVLLPAPRDG